MKIRKHFYREGQLVNQQIRPTARLIMGLHVLVIGHCDLVPYTKLQTELRTFGIGGRGENLIPLGFVVVRKTRV